MPQQALFLLVEDNESDVVLVRRAMAKAKVLNPLQVVESGEKAVAYLNGEGRYSDRAQYPLPALVLLDLKLPGLDGFGVLKWIRQNPGLKALRVVVLTSSDDMRDVNLAYQLGANSFLVKPAEFETFNQIANVLSGYWLWMEQAPEVSRLSPAEEKESVLKTGQP